MCESAAADIFTDTATAAAAAGGGGRSDFWRVSRVRPPADGTVQWRLHQIFFLLFPDFWTLLSKISKGVALTRLGNFY